MDVLEIKLLTGCWGDEVYFGYWNGRQHTEGYDTAQELIDDYPIFENAKVIK